MTKKFEKIILHVGWDKTGSTAIQQFFDSNRNDVYAKFSIFYPEGRWHAPLGSYFSDNPANYIENKYSGIKDLSIINDRDKDFIKKMELSIDSCNATSKVLVLSYEGFIYLDAAALPKLKSFLQQYSTDVSVLIYLRPIFSYALSAMSQRAKQGEALLTNGRAPIAHYKTIIEKFISVFGEEQLIVRLFDPNKLYGGDVIIDFMGVCGVSESTFRNSFPLPKHDNASLKWPAIIFSDSLRRYIDKKGVSLSVSAYGDLIGRWLDSVKGPKFQLTDRQARDLINISQNDLTYIKTKFDIDLLDTPFSEKLDIGYDEFTSILESLAQPVGEALTSSPTSNHIKNKYNGRIGLSGVIGQHKSASSFFLNVFIENNSNETWKIDSAQGPFLSYHWYKKNNLYDFEGNRTPITMDELLSGERAYADIQITSPKEAGLYTLCITAVKEHECWCENAGLIPCYLDIEIQ